MATMRVREIAGFLQARFEGDGDASIDGVAPIEEAGANELSFVGNRKAAAAAMHSGAGCLLVPDEFPAGRTLIRTGDPRTAFARVIGLLYPKPRGKAGVHAMAVVAADAVVADSASIGAHVVIGAGHADSDFAALLEMAAASAGLALESENADISDGLDPADANNVNAVR